MYAIQIMTDKGAYVIPNPQKVNMTVLPNDASQIEKDKPIASFARCSFTVTGETNQVLMLGDDLKQF